MCVLGPPVTVTVSNYSACSSLKKRLHAVGVVAQEESTTNRKYYYKPETAVGFDRIIARGGIGAYLSS